MLYCCSKCKVEKAETEFTKASDRRRGLRSTCKTCDKAVKSAYYWANPDKFRALAKKWHAANPETARNCQLKKKFGITLAQYNELLNLQNGVCAICQKLCASGMALAVDHDHEVTPLAIRGLLCNTCNRAIGLLRDSPQICLSAASYLQRPKQISNSRVDSFGYMSPC